MRFKQIVETTTAGSVATVAQPMMTQTRENVNVPGLKPVQQLMKGKSKKKGPYANSINEGKVKELAMDLKELTDEEFKKKYSKTKAEIKADMKKVNEDDLSEQDLIVIPGQGRLRRTGFVKQDLDQGEHEGHTLKNSLHTIARAASDLDKRLSVQSEFPEWVSEKIGAAKGMMVTVMDYLISSQEMQQTDQGVAEEYKQGSSEATAKQVYQYLIQKIPGFMYTAPTADVKKAISKAMSFGPQISVPDLASYAYGILKTNDLDEGEKNTSYMNKQNQDFYNKNPNFKRDDRGVKFVGNQLASIVTPTNKPGQIAKKPMTPFRTQGVEEGNHPFRGVGGAFDRGDDERHDLDPTDWYIVKDGEMFSASIYPRQVQQAIAQGFSRTRAEAKSRANSQGVAEGSLEEVDRRGFLKGLGAAAMAGAAGSLATKANAQSAQNIPALIDKIKVSMSNNMIDPESAKYRDIKVYDTADRSGNPVWLITGQFDSKNRMGGYTGYQGFFVAVNQSTSLPVAMDFEGKNPLQAGFVQGKYKRAIESGKLVYDNGQQVQEESVNQGVAEEKIDFAKKLQKNVDKSNKAVVKTRQDIGSRIADIGAGGKEYNVKTDAAWDAAKKKVAEGSAPKEKQKTPYRDINGPEYKAAADKQKEKMAKDKEAEPGKKLADKIDNKKK